MSANARTKCELCLPFPENQQHIVQIAMFACLNNVTGGNKTNSISFLLLTK